MKTYSRILVTFVERGTFKTETLGADSIEIRYDSDGTPPIKVKNKDGGIFAQLDFWQLYKFESQLI